MKSKSKMSYNLSVILLIPLGIAINFVGANLTAALKLPVYLDVIGTVFTGVLCGPWIGFLTGVVTNIVTSVTNPTQLPYMIVSGSIGLVAGICGKKGMFKPPHQYQHNQSNENVKNYSVRSCFLDFLEACFFIFRCKSTRF